jgi:hypothetical protein
MLNANTNSIVEMKSFSWTCSTSAELSRQLRFPRPESTAVEMTTVLPRAHNDAAMTMTLSNEFEQPRRCDRYQAMIVATVQRAYAR